MPTSAAVLDRTVLAPATAEAEAGFAVSPNRLFATRVRDVDRLAPRFARLTLEGQSLAHIVDRELDQRIKILLPSAGASAGSAAPAEPADLPGLHDGAGERAWRAAWRALDPAQRPILRSYTVSRSRPGERTIAVDFYLHEPAGPASRFAAAARPGDGLLLSAPGAHDASGSHGVQFRPGAADTFWVGGDEAAFPAIAGIVRGLRAGQRAVVVLECDEPGDAAWLRREPTAGTVRFDVVRRGAGGSLEEAADAFLAGAARNPVGDGFYAWMATETRRVKALERRFLRAGLDAGNLHGQGYWTRR